MKSYNDGDDAPRFIPAGKEPVVVNIFFHDLEGNNMRYEESIRDQIRCGTRSMLNDVDDKVVDKIVELAIITFQKYQNEIQPCKCGDFPRVRTNGGSYVHLYCKTCGYESPPFLWNYLSEVIEKWNMSDRDRLRQKTGAAAFDRMMTEAEIALNSVTMLTEKKPKKKSKWLWFM